MTRLDEDSNLVDRVRTWVDRDPDAIAYTFLGDGENESGSWTRGELDGEGKAVAALLQENGLVGERILLLLPSGLELLSALYGALYAGVTFIVSPIPPPGKKAQLDRLLSIVADAKPRAVLALPQLKETFQSSMAGLGLNGVRWLTHEDIDRSAEWRSSDLGPDTLAFLQYTSGSTSAPRGVMVSHGNLLVNTAQITKGMGHEPGQVTASWLPVHHDMGLVGMIFGVAYAGMRGIMMSPLHFIQKPMRWLKAISRYRCHTAGGPNFAYELCAQKATPEQCEGLDLSCWRVAFNGAEPVRAATLKKFVETFSDVGLRPEALFPCYGLAEATLFVGGPGRDDPPVVRTYDAEALKRDQVVPATPDREARALVSSGRVWDQEVVIADQETGSRCPPGQIGEVWLAGPNVCQGYWGLPKESDRTFRARLTGEPELGPFLRTGDLGFLEDENLFITGRSKDLIIIDGSNHYPQDIEQTVEESELSIRPGSCAAISVDAGETERLVVLVELRRRKDLAQASRLIRRLVAEEHGLRVHAIELLRPGSLLKTTSGKIQRHACKTAYLKGDLARWETTAGEA